MILDRRQLIYFQAIVEKGSFSQAASVLGVAQPALSRHVKMLEARLGVPLLERLPIGVRPTDAGSVLLRWSGRLLTAFDQAEEEVRNVGKEARGQVKIGMPGTLNNMLALPLIKLCRERHPQIKIVIAEAMSGFIEEWIQAGRVDIALTYDRTPGVGTEWRTLLEEELVVIGPPETEPIRSLRALDGTSMILPSKAHGLRSVIQDVFAKYGLEIEPAIEIDSYLSIVQLVMDGFGCSILPLSAVEPYSAKGRLTVHRISGVPFRRLVHLGYIGGSPAPRAVNIVLDLIPEVTSSLVAESRWSGAQIKQSDS